MEKVDGMAWEIVSYEAQKLEREILKSTSKIAMRMLDRVSEAQGVKWKETLMIAGEICGKTKGLSLGECRKVIEEIKRRKNGN